MMQTQLNVWACWLALGLAVASQKARAQPPVEPGVSRAAPGGEERPPQKVVVTTPQAKDVTITQRYACQIRAQRHLEIRALVTGVLTEVPVKEGQAVKKGDVLFKTSSTLYKAKLDAELAEVRVAQIEFDNLKKLFDKRVISREEVALAEAKLARAQAKAKLAEVELSFTTVQAPFDGLIGRLPQQEGSLVKQEDSLTTLSDNAVMWAYFNVAEARYLDLKARAGKSEDVSRLKLADSRIELELANGGTFDRDAGNVVTIEGNFNNQTGNIAFRADFPNPDRLLRHGQTGTVLIRRAMKNALVIPRRATLEALDGRYVYVVGKDGVVHLREVAIQHEVGDTFVIEKGLDVNDRIVLDGAQRVRDGEKVECEFRKPGGAIGSPKTGREK